VALEFIPSEDADPAGPQTRTSSRWAWLRSLSARLVYGVVALVVVLVAAIGATTYLSLRAFLYQRLDHSSPRSPRRTRRAWGSA
jgi:hypothetical protein